MRTIYTLIILGLLLATGVAAHADPPRYTLHDGLEMARACVHEATWAGATRPDCGAMLQVVEARRAPGEPFVRALHRTMPRFAAGTTSRAWVRGLPAGPLVSSPAGWPYTYSASAHADAWRAVFERVRGFMQGSEPLPCEETPWHWFSPGVDGHAISSRLESGLWRVAHCGDTHNVFMYRVMVD